MKEAPIESRPAKMETPAVKSAPLEPSNVAQSSNQFVSPFALPRAAQTEAVKR